MSELRIIVPAQLVQQPSLDQPFAGGLTLGQWLALSDSEQEALWEKWEEKEWKKLEKKYGAGVDVKLKPRNSHCLIWQRKRFRKN